MYVRLATLSGTCEKLSRRKSCSPPLQNVQTLVRNRHILKTIIQLKASHPLFLDHRYTTFSSLRGEVGVTLHSWIVAKGFEWMWWWSPSGLDTRTPVCSPMSFSLAGWLHWTCPLGWPRQPGATEVTAGLCGGRRSLCPFHLLSTAMGANDRHRPCWFMTIVGITLMNILGKTVWDSISDILNF